MANNNNNEVDNMTTNNNMDAMNKQMMQQFKSMMNTPIMKKAMLQAEKMMAESKQKLDSEKGLEAIHKEAITKFMMGNPSDRGRNFLHVVDGTLLRVVTDERSIVKDVSPVKNFESLEMNERAYLYENDKALYKKLQVDAYSPNITDRVVNLMALEGDCMKAYFDIEVSNPSKPTLSNMPLGGIEASEVLANYTKDKEAYNTAKASYLSEVEMYQKGEIHNNLRECQDRIVDIELELKGEA